MLYVTHHFAHSETLDRARRWLIQAGVSPDRMHVHRQGVPSLSVVVEPAEVDGIEMVIHAAENKDPDGLPSFWDLARLEPEELGNATEEVPTLTVPETPPHFVLAWHPIDTISDEEVGEQIEAQRAYRETR